MSKDWRGTEIHVGDTVIYGAGVGRSVAMVEGEVVGFTDSGRVKVFVSRRSYGGGYASGKDVVHVGADRLTVVLVLPESERITEQDKRSKERERLLAYYTEQYEQWKVKGNPEPRYQGQWQPSDAYYQKQIAKFTP